MRLLSHIAVSAGLCLGLAGSAALAVAALFPAMGSAALAATGQSTGGSATAAVSPRRAMPGGEVTFAISCASTQASSATLFGTTLGLPDRIPMTNGAVSGDFVISVSLPRSIAPGNYTPAMDCSDGSSAAATLTVTSKSSSIPAAGGAATGDGTTSTQTNTGLALGGLGMIGVGGVVGGLAMRRRNTTTRRP